MKKKFGILFVILLCVALVLTVASCGNKEVSPLTGVAASEVKEVNATIQADIERWLQSYASDSVPNLERQLSDFLKSDDNLSSYTHIDSKSYEDLEPEISVSFDQESEIYTVTFTWTNGECVYEKQFTSKAVVVTYNGWAGSFKEGVFDGIQLTDKTTSDGKLLVLDSVLDAVYAMVNQTVTGASDGVFGVEGTLGIGYGVINDDETLGENKYGIDVKGNIDLSPIFTKNDKDELVRNNNGTNFSIVAKNLETSKVFGGLYYENGATDKASKLYISYLEKVQGEDDAEPTEELKYIYLDYAILNQLFDKIGVEFKEADPVFSSDSGKTGMDLLIDMILSNMKNAPDGLTETVSGIAASLIDAYEGEDDDTEDKIYVIDINFGNLVSTLSTYADLADEFVSKYTEGIDGLSDLKIGEMNGLIGHLTISVIADKDSGALKNFELAVNIPETTFYLSADKTKTHFDIPAISVSLYVEDFLLSEDEVEDVIPAEVAEATYFSPTNFNIQGDVTLFDETANLNDTFRYHLVTEINPFKPSMAKASFTIMQTQGDTFDPNDCTTFLKVTYDQSTKTIATSGTAYNMPEDGGSKVYVFDIANFDLDEVLTWLGIDVEGGEWHGFSYKEIKDAAGKVLAGYYYIVGLGENREDPTYNGWEHLVDNAKIFFDNNLGRYLLEYYKDVKTPETQTTNNGNTSAAAPTTGTDGSATGTASGTNGSKEKKSFTDIASGVMDVISTLIDENVTIDTEDNSFAFLMTADQINDLVDAINDIVDKEDFDLIAFFNRHGASIPNPITDPSEIDLQVNTDEHKDQFYLTFTYSDDVYEIIFDNSEKEDQQFSFNFKLEKTEDDKTNVYTFDLVFTEDEISAEYKKNGVRETAVTHKNFAFDWGSSNSDKLEMYSETELKNAKSFFDATDLTQPSLATRLLGGTKGQDGKYSGGLMDFLNNDIVLPIAKIFGRMGVRAIAKYI